MHLADFDYQLPDELIARFPPAARRDSRLLVVSNSLQDSAFASFPAFLNAGDLLVFNNTRVIRARLHGQKDTGGRVEVLIERIETATEAIAQMRSSKTAKAGAVLQFAEGCTATVSGREGALFKLRFSEPLEPYLCNHGEVPLPPYLNRGESATDEERYQTIYADRPGAVAAPTAGLHFDLDMLAETKALGVGHAFITLHVGAGTFQPLRNERVGDNALHSERIEVDETVCAAINSTQANGGRVIAVGTTTVRALEAASRGERIEPFTGETDIFIQPGFKFRSVDALLTNFHLPKSSLMVLVSAFAGQERIMSAYRHAVEQQYRFFSYGDAMLLFPELA